MLASVVAAVVLPIQSSELKVILALSLVVAGVGLIDDARHVAAGRRFATQVFAVAGGLAAAGIFQGPHLWIGVIVLLGAIWWVNLFNFMDGIDGIAATQAIFMFLAAVALAAWKQHDVSATANWLWMIAIAAAVAAFLLFNWPPASIFMGDVGSTWLAYVLVFMAVISVRDGWLTAPVWLILGGGFVADSTTTLIRRVIARARWFEAHRSHAYQRLAVRWGAHKPVTLLAIAINVLWLAPLAYAAQATPEWGWAYVGIAYAPLIAGAYASGAGITEPEHA